MDVERDEVVRRLGEEGFVVLDVRSAGEYRGETTAPCDPRAGRIAGAEHFDLQLLLALTPDEISERLGRRRTSSSSPIAIPARGPSLRPRSSPRSGTGPRTTAAPGTSGRGTTRCLPRPARRPAGTPSRACGELVPVLDSLAGRRPQRRWVGDVVRILRQPRLDLVASDLRVELDAPRTAEPERLRADRAAGQLDGPLREVVRVVVPLEGVEPLRQGCRDRIAGTALGQLDLEPADLGLGGPEDAHPLRGRSAATRGRRRAWASRARAPARAGEAPAPATGDGPPGRDAWRPEDDRGVGVLLGMLLRATPRSTSSCPAASTASRRRLGRRCRRA